MSDEHEINAAHEARIAELERQLAALQDPAPAARARLSRRRVATFGVILAVLVVPGVVLANHQFTDVPTTHPFHGDISWVAHYDIANGYDDGTYRPGNAVTRQAIAAFLRRLSNATEVVESSINPPASTSFSHYVECPGFKRPVAGGGHSTHANLVITDSYPDLRELSSDAFTEVWAVDWKSDGNTLVDPTEITVYATCVPHP